MTKEELDDFFKQYRDFRRQRAEKKLKEVYEPKLKDGVTFFDEFAFETDTRKESEYHADPYHADFAWDVKTVIDNFRKESE